MQVLDHLCYTIYNFYKYIKNRGSEKKLKQTIRGWRNNGFLDAL